MPKFRVWDPIADDEIEVLRRNDQWAVFKSMNHRTAADAFALEVCTDSMDLLAAESFIVHVRDLETNVLYEVDFAWEWEPKPRNDGDHEIALEFDSFRQASEHMEYCIANAAEEMP